MIGMKIPKLVVQIFDEALERRVFERALPVQLGEPTAVFADARTGRIVVAALVRDTAEKEPQHRGRMKRPLPGLLGKPPDVIVSAEQRQRDPHIRIAAIEKSRAVTRVTDRPVFGERRVLYRALQLLLDMQG